MLQQGSHSLPQLSDAPVLMEEPLKDESNGSCLLPAGADKVNKATVTCSQGEDVLRNADVDC